MKGMKRSRALFVLGLLAACFLSLSSSTSGGAQAHGGGSQNPPVKAVLIHKTGYLCGDEAVLVTDARAVKALSDLVLSNETVGHACDFHWLIRFIRSDGSIVTRAHNIECEQYLRDDRKVHALLDSYFDRVLKSPSHFIVGLKVRSAEAPDQLSTALAKEGRVFLLDDPEGRLPRLTLRATTERPIPKDRHEWDAATSANNKAVERLLASAVAMLKGKLPVLSVGPAERPSSEFGGGKIVDNLEQTVFFRFGATLNQIPALPPGVSAGRVVTPDQYDAELVTPTRLDRSRRDALRARYPFLTAVSRFDEGCVPVR
jgi:hypothetical protein